MPGFIFFCLVIVFLLVIVSSTETNDRSRAKPRRKNQKVVGRNKRIIVNSQGRQKSYRVNKYGEVFEE